MKSGVPVVEQTLAGSSGRPGMRCNGPFSALLSLAFVGVLSLGAFGCGSSDSEGSTPTPPGDVLPSLHAVPTPAGGLALYTPILQIPVGADITYCTYSDYVTDRDLFIHTTKGAQSSMGHHGLIFYTPTPELDKGTEVCTSAGMEKFRQLIGGTGGEQGASVWEPPWNVGAVVPKGSQFVLQTHWINAGREPVEVQAMMVTEPGIDGPDRIETGTLSTVDLGFNLPPMTRTTSGVECVFASEQRLLMSLGHEHEWGTHVKAEVTRADGRIEMMFDRPFEEHHVFDPPINGYSVEQPFVFAAGDKLSFSCEWENNTTEAIGFPREMCVFFGVSMTPGDARCINGTWTQ